MQIPRSFETAAGDAASADEGPDVSRRLVLAAGAASALMATGCVTPPDLPPHACPSREPATVVTPPNTQATIVDMQKAAKLQARTAMSNRSLIAAEIGPFAIKVQGGTTPASLSAAEQARQQELSTLNSDLAKNEDALRERVVAGLRRKAACTASGALWNDQTGVGPSTVTLYRGGATQKVFETIEIPGASLETIQDSIFHMRTDPQRLEQIELQVKFPHVYLAAALSADARVLAEPNLVNWTCQAINCVGWFATALVIDLKCDLLVPRPRVISKEAPRPIIAMPDYSSYPGGHAAFLAALYVVLMDITGANPTQALQFRGLPERIAENRERAGLHTRVDTRAGWEFGTALGQAMLRWVNVNDDPNDIDWAVIYKSAKAEWS